MGDARGDIKGDTAGDINGDTAGDNKKTPRETSRKLPRETEAAYCPDVKHCPDIALIRFKMFASSCYNLRRSAYTRIALMARANAPPTPGLP